MIIRVIEAAKYDFYKDVLSPEEFEALNSIYPKYSVWIINNFIKSMKEYSGYPPSINPMNAILSLSDHDRMEKNKKDTIGYLITNIPKDLEKYQELVDKNFVRSEEAKGTHYENNPQSLDLQKYDFDRLYQLINSGIARNFLDGLKYRNYKKDAKIVTIYKDDNWLILHPENHAATILVGSGSFGDGSQTRWCVSSKNAQSESHYKFYSDNMEGHCPIIFIQRNDTKERWLIGGREDIIADSYDDQLNVEESKALLNAIPDEADAKANEFTDGKFSELLDGDLGGFTCDRCGDKETGDSYPVGDEQWCEYCSDNYSFYCEWCGETHSDDDIGGTDDSYTYCQSCADDMSNCSDCGNLMSPYSQRKGGACDNNGTCYCHNCWDNHTICADCGNFTDNPQEGDDSDWYCPDCIDDHKEPEDERVECQNCEGTGQVSDGKGSYTTCPACDGTGLIEESRVKWILNPLGLIR